MSRLVPTKYTAHMQSRSVCARQLRPARISGVNTNPKHEESYMQAKLVEKLNMLERTNSFKIIEAKVKINGT